MIFRSILLAFSLFLLLGSVGCQSPGASPFDRAFAQGPAGLTRACANGIRPACALRGTAAAPAHPLPILQGLTSGDRARFTVVVPYRARLAYFVRDGERVRELNPARRSGPSTDYAVDRLDVDGLRPNEDFELIAVERSTSELLDRRTFATLDLAKSHARIAVVSATDDAKIEEARQMWPEVLGQRPDALLLVGDNVYVDHPGPAGGWISPTPGDLWRRYVETRRALPLFFAPRLVPTVATWDDHDFAYHDADRTYPHAAAARETFLTFFAQGDSGPSFSRGPGIAAWWTAFGVEFALMDNRSFRSVDHAAGAQTHFGAEQEDWLSERLGRADRPVLVVSGDPFFGDYHPFESFAGDHPENFAAVLGRWRKLARTPLVFVSGDRGWTEVLEVPSSALGYPTFEITSSGLHARTFPHALRDHPNPHRVAGVDGRANFCVIETMRAEKSLLRLSVQAFGPGRELYFQKTLVVKR